jgi:hypothetical protein
VVVVLEGGRLLRKAIAVSDDQPGADGVNREVVDGMEQQIGIAPEGKKTTTVPAIHKIEEWLEDYLWKTYLRATCVRLFPFWWVSLSPSYVRLSKRKPLRVSFYLLAYFGVSYNAVLYLDLFIYVYGGRSCELISQLACYA